MKSLSCTILIFILLEMPKAYSQILGDPLVHWDFANGIPSSWINSSESGIANWEYRGPDTDPDISVCSRGSCGAASQPITSLTAENGFVIFDSNYWDDDDDVCGGLGTGQDPAPHTAWLTTEPMDFSSYSTLVLTWQQQFKHYISSTKVQISNDGGNTFVDIFTNPGSFSPVSEWRTVNINTWAANQPDVRFRFLFSGTYYWWLLDDIVVYSPNPNDIMLSIPKYTTFNPLGTLPYHDMDYNMYPLAMIPQFMFSGTGINIGGNSQTQVKLQVKVKEEGITQLYNGQSTMQTLTAGQTSTFSLTTPFTTPPVVAEYKIEYDLDQLQTDDNVSNNKDTLNYFISPYAYAHDENSMEDKFVPAAIYVDQPMSVGNLYEGRNNTAVCHSVSVAIAEGTLPGTQIIAQIYKTSISSLLSVSEPYTVNAADINETGGNFFVTLPLEAPVAMQTDSLYIAMVSKVNPDDDLFISRSGVAPPEIALVSYPQSNALFYMFKYPMVRLNLFSPTAIPGCIDPNAMNFDSVANTDDGSCQYDGCTNPLASNFDPNANWDDGSCIIGGCTNPEADNYDPEATSDNGSCLFSGCTDPNADNYDVQANIEDGSCFYLGCTDPSAMNFDDEATVDDGSCLYPGCTDPEADNFNAIANFDDGSCLYSGCTNPDAVNYDPQANVDDGSCIIPGCTDPQADNFNVEANTDDGSCFYLGCTDPLADNFDSSATIDDGSCIYLGCTDPEANNFDPGANVDDFSCLYNEATMDVSATSGCSPFSFTIYNQTQIAEGAECLIEITDGTLINTCIGSFTHTIEVPGDYFIYYTYTQGTSVTTDTIGPISVFPVPSEPLISFDLNTLWMTCLNCQENEVVWTYNNSDTITAQVDSLMVFHDDMIFNGYYQMITENEYGCSATSDSLLALVATLDSDVSFGCWPLEVSFFNPTSNSAEQSCELNFGDGNSSDDCQNEWVYEYSSPGNYEASITIVSDGVVASSNTIVISVFDYPPQPVLSFNEESDLIVCEGCDGYEVIWYFNGNEITGGLTDIPYTGNGSYSVTVNNVNGCSTVSANLDVVQDAIFYIPGEHFSVFPNPCDEEFGILFPSAFIGRISIEVFDVNGNLCTSKLFSPTNSVYVSTSHLKAGVYTVQIIGESNIEVYRLLVTH